MENPFRYGDIVKDDYFTDREKEINEIVKDIESSQNIFFYSPRKYGKTSLMTKTLELLKKKNFITIYLDFFLISSSKTFLELYAKAISKGVSTKFEEVKKFVTEYLSGFIPKIVIKGEDMPDIEFDYVSSRSNMEKSLLELYDIPQIICQKRVKRGVVVFDEFQEIRNFGGVDLEKQIRAKIQHHDKISYIFVGSKKGMLLDMFTDKKRPLYNIGKMLTLKKIPEVDLRIFIKQRFNSTSYIIKDEVITGILEITRSHPYYVQMLCHEIWDNLSHQEISFEDIKNAVEQIFLNQSELYFSIWENLSLHQRALLTALIKTEAKNIYSAQFISEHNLGSNSLVQKSIKMLVKKDIVEKDNGVYEVQDIFFKEWIKTRI